MKILINVVNARNVGGGLQVVQNFLLCTQKYIRPEIEWYYAVSECLDTCYLDNNFRKNAEDRYFVFPNQPDFRHTYVKVQKELRNLENSISPDVIYTILGPCYNFFKHKEVVRFANAWSTNPNPYAWSTLHGKNKLRTKLYGILERALLRRSKYLITQTETVQEGLHRVTGLPLSRICVVQNVLPDIFNGLPNSHIEEDNCYFDVAAVGGQMPHKNLEIIPEILELLSHNYELNNVRFHTTLPEDSDVWHNIQKKLNEYDIEDNVLNHGKLTLPQLAEMYRRCEFAFLPSVLETFSASTIEAMHFDLKTVASDLSFNTEVMQDACLYFEPMNAESAAGQIAKLIADKDLQKVLSEKMKERLKNYIDYKKYFDNTVDFLVKVGNHDL